MTASLAKKFQEAYLQVDPGASGQLFVHKEGKALVIGGTLHSGKNCQEELTRIAQELVPHSLPLVTVVNTASRGLSVTLEENEVRETHHREEERTLDEVKVLFFGELPLVALRQNEAFKRENWHSHRKVETAMGVLGFSAPLVVDRNLTIIDGGLRLTILRELLETGKTSVSTALVVVLDAEGVEADLLRLLLNRASEFQRWKYPEVHEFVDALPQVQPLLEPFGFFGERILPTTFFGNTVVNYTIDPYNLQQKVYKQEIGLAAWAEIQRERIMAEEEARKASKVKAPQEGMVSLFDLDPQEDDFLPTYPMKDELQGVLEATKREAGGITEAYDRKRRAEKEARGQAWQTTRRSTKAVVAALREEAEAAVDADEWVEESESDEDLGEE